MRFEHISACLLVIVSSLVVYSGCGSSSDKDPCLEDCENRSNACPGSAGMGDSAACAQLCTAAREGNPAACRDKIDAFFQCAIDKETYTCKNGVLEATPMGGCAAEGAACAQCTGKALCYIDF